MNEDYFDDVLPPHKREGYAERMYGEADMRRKLLSEAYYEAADFARKEKREQELRDQIAIQWAIDTGAME